MNESIEMKSDDAARQGMSGDSTPKHYDLSNRQLANEKIINVTIDTDDLINDNLTFI